MGILLTVLIVIGGLALLGAILNKAQTYDGLSKEKMEERAKEVDANKSAFSDDDNTFDPYDPNKDEYYILND